MTPVVSLCLDAGNTRVKWGLRGERGWLATGSCTHAEIATLPAHLPQTPQRLIACNVAGAAVATHCTTLAHTLGTPLDWFRSTAAAAGVRNGYAAPQQLGADRWAALIGARHLHRGPAIVVMAGTATTIDLLDAAGNFLGGLILPGLDLMRRSLARNTADLPAACGTYQPIPDHTDAAIISGSIEATVGAIERMAARLARRPASADQPAGRRTPRSGGPGHRAGLGAAEHFLCLLSGGAAQQLAPHLAMPLRQIDNLVLEGLAVSVPVTGGAASVAKSP